MTTREQILKLGKQYNVLNRNDNEKDTKGILASVGLNLQGFSTFTDKEIGLNPFELISPISFVHVLGDFCGEDIPPGHPIDKDYFDYARDHTTEDLENEKVEIPREKLEEIFQDSSIFQKIA